MFVRHPAFAGQFYPHSRAELETLIATFEGKKHLPAAHKNVIAAMSPHAGYVYSGLVAAQTLRHAANARTYIIIGPNHTGYGEEFSIMTEGAWDTPLGQVKINHALASDIAEHSPLFEEDSQAHLHEHSLEVQLPFLQYFNKKEFDFVPIVIGGGALREYRAIARTIFDAAESHADCILIASSDMTHYEPKPEAESKDKLALSYITALDEEGLYRCIQQYHISMCGYAPAIIMIAYAKLKGARNAELVSYRTSGDASGDYASVVGYAGVIIEG